MNVEIRDERSSIETSTCGYFPFNSSGPVLLTTRPTIEDRMFVCPVTVVG